MMRSISVGICAFSVLGGIGSRLRMPSKTTAVVAPGREHARDFKGAQLVEVEYRTPGIGQTSKVVRWDANP